MRTGAIIVCDPFLADTGPLVEQVAPGRYPARACIISYSSGDRRVACAMLSLTGSRPVRWTLALNQDLDVSGTRTPSTSGYYVEAGTACFMDAEVERLQRRRAALAEEDEPGSYFEYLQHIDDELLQRLAENANLYTTLVVDEHDGLNVIAFSSGWGDGYYRSYLGYDDQGILASLVTDFALVATVCK